MSFIIESVRYMLAFFGSLRRHLVLEIILFCLFAMAFWLITRVQPNGEIVGAGGWFIEHAERLTSRLASLFGGEDENQLAPVNPRSRLERIAVGGFCSLASIAGTYVAHNAVLTYFVAIPCVLIVLFVYNNAKPETFSYHARIAFSLVLFTIIVTCTFKLIELQDVQKSIVQLPSSNFFPDEYDYRCEDLLAAMDGESGPAKMSLFISNLSTFLSELRLYLLALLLWILGREAADMKRIRKVRDELHEAVPKGGKSD